MATRNWSGAVNTAWDTAGNWDTPPVAGDSVVFNVHPDSITIWACTTPPGAPISLAMLTVGVNYETHPLNLTGCTFATAVLDYGTLTNCGTIGRVTSWIAGTLMAGTIGTVDDLSTGATTVDIEGGAIGTIGIFGPRCAIRGGTIGRVESILAGAFISGGTFTDYMRIDGAPAVFSEAAAPLNLSGCAIHAYAAFTITDSGANGITTNTSTRIYILRSGVTVTQAGVSIPEVDMSISLTTLSLDIANTANAIALAITNSTNATAASLVNTQNTLNTSITTAQAAITDRGNAAWVTASGFSTNDATATTVNAARDVVLSTGNAAWGGNSATSQDVTNAVATIVATGNANWGGEATVNTTQIAIDLLGMNTTPYTAANTVGGDLFFIKGSQTNAAADIVTIRLKTDTLGSGTVTVSSPLSATNALSLVAGQDYKAADGTGLQWVITNYAGPNVNAATGSLRFMLRNTYESSVTTVTLTANTNAITQVATTVTINADLSNAQTLNLGTAGANPPDDDYNFRYQIWASTATSNRCLVDDKATILKRLPGA